MSVSVYEGRMTGNARHGMVGRGDQDAWNGQLRSLFLTKGVNLIRFVKRGNSIHSRSGEDRRQANSAFNNLFNLRSMI